MVTLTLGGAQSMHSTNGVISFDTGTAWLSFRQP